MATRRYTSPRLQRDPQLVARTPTARVLRCSGHAPARNARALQPSAGQSPGLLPPHAPAPFLWTSEALLGCCRAPPRASPATLLARAPRAEARLAPLAQGSRARAACAGRLPHPAREVAPQRTPV